MNNVPKSNGGDTSISTSPNEVTQSHAPTGPTPQSSRHSEWIRLLANRGILESALEAEWHYGEYKGQPGWEIPLYDEDGHRWCSDDGKPTSRWKYSGSEVDVQRYAWPEGKPKGCDYYHLPHANLRTAIEAHDGELVIACGEPDMLTFATAGITNVTSFFGENNIPSDLTDTLTRLAVKVVHYFPDRDGPGAQAAEKLALTLRPSHIELRLHDLPSELEGQPVKDINDAYCALGHDEHRFRAFLEGLPCVSLKNAQSEDAAETSAGNAATRCRPKLPEPGKQLPEQFYTDLEQALKVQEYESTGWSKLIACPFKNHEHDDTRPAASYHRDMHIVHCFKCGETWLACDVGPVLGLYVRDYTKAIRQKALSMSEADEAIDTLDNEQRHERKKSPTDDELGDSFTAEWGDSLAYFYADFYHYENGFWSPMPGVDGLIWDELKLHKVDGIRPTSARVSSVRSYVTDKLRVPKELVENGDNYINLQNGLYNLDMGQLEDHQPRLYLTSQLGFAYDPSAECPTWKRCLEEWLTTADGKPDREQIDLLQEGVGYSLTADTSRETSFWLYGPPGSGKSTVLKVIMELAGNSHLVIDLNVLDKNLYQLADIGGKRVLICAEARAGSALVDNVLKSIISGEKLRVRHPCGRNFDVISIAKVWWAMNVRPANRDSSGAIERRLKQILFRNSIPEDRRDRKLFAKLQEELPGIFNWAMEGLRRLNDRDDFTHSAQAAQALEEYRLENDVERLFVNDAEWCVLEPREETQSSHLYDAYKAWAARNGHSFKTSTAVGKRWEDFGLTKYKNGVMYYRGIGLTAHAKRVVQSMN